MAIHPPAVLHVCNTAEKAGPAATAAPANRYGFAGVSAAAAAGRGSAQPGSLTHLRNDELGLGRDELRVGGLPLLHGVVVLVLRRGPPFPAEKRNSVHNSRSKRPAQKRQIRQQVWATREKRSTPSPRDGRWRPRPLFSRVTDLHPHHPPALFEPCFCLLGEEKARRRE